MSTRLSGLPVYLISFNSEEYLVYFDPLNLGRDSYYNAGTLQLINQDEISPSGTLKMSKVLGLATAEFGVSPVVFRYSDHRSEILYAPKENNQLYKSDRSLIEPGYSEVTQMAIIQIPNLEKTPLGSFNSNNPLPSKLSRIPLDLPNKQSIEKYIASFKSKKDLLPNTQGGKPQRGKEQRANEQREIQSLKNRVSELETCLEILIRRLYRISTIEIPTSLSFKGVTGKVIREEEANLKIQNKEIEKYDLIPFLQPYAGSHHTDERIVTFYTKDGSVYHACWNTAQKGTQSSKTEGAPS